MIKHWTKSTFVFTSALFIGSTFQYCSSSKEELQASDIAATFQRGVDYFEKDNYIKAEEVFTFIIYNDPGGAFADDAQFNLAETYYEREEFLLAISEYDRLIRRMKNSSYVEDAFWRKTEAYCELSPDFRLERDMTDKALKYLYEIVDIYPESKYISDAENRILEMRGKLAKKLLESARLYDTLREYESAVYYYDTVIEEYPDTREYASARLGKAGDMVALERWSEARELLNSVAISGRENLTVKEITRMRSLGEAIMENSDPVGD